MDEQIKKFLEAVHVRTDGKLAADWRPEFILVGDPDCVGYLVCDPKAKNYEEWVKLIGTRRVAAQEGEGGPEEWTEKQNEISRG